MIRTIFVIIECAVIRASNTVILEVFEGYNQNSRASRSNTTYEAGAPIVSKATPTRSKARTKDVMCVERAVFSNESAAEYLCVGLCVCVLFERNMCNTHYVQHVRYSTASALPTQSMRLVRRNRSTRYGVCNSSHISYNICNGIT